MSKELDEAWVRDNPKLAADELALLKRNRDMLHSALEGVMEMVEAGELVRNIRDDAKAEWASSALKTVQKLQAAQVALEF
jgi:hypothetical protein